MTRIIATLFIAFLMGCGSDETNVVSIDPDHAVMEAAIVSYVQFGDSSDHYTLSEKPTLWRWIGELGVEELRADLHKIEKLDSRLIDSFLSINKKPSIFDHNQFPKESRLRTISEEDHLRLFKQNGKGWQQFVSEFGTRGIVYLSRPAFSSDGNSVLIAIWHQRHSEWQRGVILIGERKAGNWIFRELRSTIA